MKGEEAGGRCKTHIETNAHQQDENNYIFLNNFRGMVIMIKHLMNVRRQVKNNMTMCDTFQQTLEKHRDKVAFIFEDKYWTFQEVEYFSNKVANHFESIGYRKGDVVALFMENRPELVFFWLGLAKIGVVSALVNFNLRKESLTHCISIVNAKGLVYSSDSSIAGNIINKKSMKKLFNHLSIIISPLINN